MARKSWFKMVAANVGNFPQAHAAIEIYEEIGAWGVTAKDFKHDLEALGDVSDIEVNIHTPGGSVLDGLAIYNLLKDHPAAIRTKIGGFAASMGTVIAMAGDTVEMPENAFFMIHRATAGTAGNADDLRDAADLVEKMDKMICRVYAAKTGQTEEYIAALMERDCWLTGQEALALGFVDAATEALEAAAMAGVRDELQGVFARMGIEMPKASAEDEAPAADPAPETDESPAPEEVAAEDLDEGGELADEAQAPAADDAAPEAYPEKSDGEPEPEGFVARVKAALHGRGNTDALAKLRGKYDEQTARLDAVVADLADALDMNAAQKSELVELRAARRTVLDLVTEAGFAPDEAASLPMPDDGEGPSAGTDEKSLEQYDAITDKDERRDFFKENKQAILRAMARTSQK